MLTITGWHQKELIFRAISLKDPNAQGYVSVKVIYCGTKLLQVNAGAFAFIFSQGMKATFYI